MPSNITTSLIEDIRNILANLSMNISENEIIRDNSENQTDILNSTLKLIGDQHQLKVAL